MAVSTTTQPIEVQKVDTANNSAAAPGKGEEERLPLEPLKIASHAKSVD